ncbi:MAG: tRNA (guanosine(37)-N1)-methyltransferase TrmD [Oligoflexales bacterium]
MLEVTFLTTAPALIESYFSFGIAAALIKNNKVTVKITNLRDYAVDKHGTIDDKPYGGGDGMVFRVEPLMQALKECPKDARVILPTPRGKVWSQATAHTFLIDTRPIVFVCPRFAGVDERFIDMVKPEEICLGDFVFSCGELGALMVLDSAMRFVHGSMTNSESAVEESFSDRMHGLLEYPVYTRPPEYEGRHVPDVLLSGDQARIREWRQAQSVRITELKRPDLIKDDKK